MSARPKATPDDQDEFPYALANAPAAVDGGAIVGSVTLLQKPAVGVAHAWVERGINVEVTGTRVCGKTTLLTDLHALLADEGWNVVRIDGLRTLRDHPLEALAVAGLIEVGRPLPPVAAVADRLGHGWSEERTIVLIDDVDCLDRASCGVLESLTRRMPLQIVSTGPLRGPDPSDRSVFRLPQPCAELTLRPWRFEELNSLLAGRFDQVIDPRLAGRIHQLSGGVPGFALALLDAAEMENRLTVQQKVLSGDGSLWHDGLARIVEDYIGTLPADERATLEALSAWGPMSAAEAGRLVPPEHLRSLERRRLLTVVRTGHHATVVVFPPLVAEHLTRSGGEIDRLLAEQHAEPARPRGEERGPLSAGQPDFDAGASGALSRLLSARRETEGFRLAEAWTAHPSATTARAYIAWLADSRESGALLDQVTARTSWEEGHDLERAMAFMDLARWEASAGHGIGTALDLLAAGRDGAGPFAPVLDHVGLQLRVIDGDVPEYDEALVPMESDAPEPVLISAASTRTYLALATGAFDAARTASEAIGAFPARPRTVLVRSLALCAQGDPLAGLQVARDAFVAAQSTQNDEGIYVCGYAAAYALQRLGRRREATEVLDLPLSLGRPRPDLEPLYQALLTLATRLAMQAGDDERAWALGQQARALQLSDGPLPAMSDAVVGLIGENGPLREIPPRVWARVEAMWERRYRYAAIIMGLWATETIPDPTRAATVSGWIDQIGAKALIPCGEYVSALARRDPDGLVSCAPGLVETGWPAHAVSALAVAEELYVAAGDELAAQGAQAQRARIMATNPEIEPDQTLSRIPSALLSDREREIVALIARGLTNRQIADELVLSVRTVENHIYRAFRKTRLTSRGQLGRIAL